VKKFQDAGYVFAEVPVHHYHRQCGVSQFYNWRRLLRTTRQLFELWVALVLRKEHLKCLPRRALQRDRSPIVFRG
jgi:hypothetical protein